MQTFLLPKSHINLVNASYFIAKYFSRKSRFGLRHSLFFIFCSPEGVDKLHLFQEDITLLFKPLLLLFSLFWF